MNHHHIFQIWIIFIIFLICSLFTLIPYDKYQKKYMDFVHDFNNVPQKHFERELEKANLYQEMETIDEKDLEKDKDKDKKAKRVNDYKKPYFIRDKKKNRRLRIRSR